MQERVDIPVHERLKNRRVHAAIVLVTADDQPEARLRQPVLRDLRARHEELVLQVRHHEPNGSARPLPQGAGQAVAPIAELLCSSEHELARSRAHPRVNVQRPRHGIYPEARFGCDVPDSRP
jgi:hypothetical protein